MAVDAVTRSRRKRERFVLAATAALVLTATLPLTRVFLGLSFLLPVLAAALLALGVGWGAGRLGAGPGLTLVATIAAWLLYASLVFAPQTLLLNVAPTPGTLVALRDLWLEGLLLVQVSPSPTFAEPALLLLAVTGVWAVAHAVDGLIVRLGAPISAIVLAMVLWTVPLALAPQNATAWMWAAPFLLASAAVLVASAGSDVGRFGRWVHPGDPAGLRAAGGPLTAGGTTLAITAVLIGSLLAGFLPGFGDPPWYPLRGSGGTSLTTNPIVGIHSRLVSSDHSPVMRVTTSRPLYLRTTSLDVYDADREVWTNERLSGGPARSPLSFDAPVGQAERLPVSMEVVNLPGGLLVPMPYQTLVVSDSRGDRLRYDARLSTFFVGEEQTLQPGDRFEVVATIPTPTAEQLNLADPNFDPALLQLPPDIPPEVGTLARDIVERAGATTRLEQAVAVQSELRSWTYSLDVVPSHRRAAMLSFITERQGYCEQFAGTMGVMLRQLGIPARVAVGFTPGIPDDPGGVEAGRPVTYTVSLANAHAWVEVLFPGYGWIAFEPTPRSDGNVLVPSATNLAPTATVSPPAATAESIGPRPEDFDRGGDLGVDAPLAEGPQAAPGTTGTATSRTSLSLVLGVVAGLALVALALLVLARHRQAPPSPRERVLAAFARLQRLGRGLRVIRRPTETDSEYVGRLLAQLPIAHPGTETRRRADQAAVRLVLRADQARWAPELPEEAAEDATDAAATLAEVLLEGRSRPERARIALRSTFGRTRARSRAKERDRDREPARV